MGSNCDYYIVTSKACMIPFMYPGVTFFRFIILDFNCNGNGVVIDRDQYENDSEII